MPLHRSRPLKVCRLAAALALCVAARAAEAQAPASSAASAAFKPLEFLVGSCWVGTFPGGKQSDEHCFEWMYDRHFIRDRHVVRGGAPYEGETTYGVDPRTGTVSYWYFSSEGPVITGTVQPTSDGLAFPSRYATPAGEVELRALWVPVGGDAYRVTRMQRSGDAWKELSTMEMRRKP